MIRKQIYEQSRVSFDEPEHGLSKSFSEKIFAAAIAAGLSEQHLELGRNYLQSRQFVGMLAAPGCQLEILPKIDRSEEATSAANCRGRLMEMLAIAHKIHIDASETTRMGLQQDTLLELLIRLFCKRLAAAVRQGIPQNYLSTEDDLPVMRGRLNVHRQFMNLAGQPQKLACRFDLRSADIPLNRIIKAALLRLMQVAEAPDNQQTLRQLTLAYADVSNLEQQAGRDEILLDRTTEIWRELLSFARLLLGSQYQNISAGSFSGYALLFDMNKLFESYISELTRQALAGTEWRVTSQGGGRCCLYEDEGGLFATNPDLIIKRAGAAKMIIDTKWKKLDPMRSERKQKISQADVYQLMVYSQIYQCTKNMLLYPHHSRLGKKEQHRVLSIAKQNAEPRLAITTIDISKSAAETKSSLAKLIPAFLQGSRIPGQPGN